MNPPVFMGKPPIRQQERLVRDHTGVPFGRNPAHAPKNLFQRRGRAGYDDLHLNV